MSKGLKGRLILNGLSLLGCLALFGLSSPATPVTKPMAAASVSSAAASAVLAAAAAAPLVTPAGSAASFEISSVLKPDRPLQHGDYLWDEDGAPSGPTRIVVDLSAQILYVYRGGVEIGRSAILYGADNKPTPTGTYPILQKKRHHVSNLYGAPMPYMLRLTMDGIAIHASEVEYGSATHGCVGIPDEFAAILFALARVGDPVLITKRWRTDIYPA